MSQNIKFENSPADSIADSFVSTPGTQYPSLFDTMDPSEVMTPQSYNDDSMFGDSMDGSMAGTPAPEKKQVKKRKSWGQQLPEPKTNLPPRYNIKGGFKMVDMSANPLIRKRAKTEDEKEQRRVERVLRNRRAAQSSRERKRQEVEALEAEKRAIERRNQDLEMRLADMEAKNIMLQRELEQFTGNMTVFRGDSDAPSPTQTEQCRRAPSPVTFSRDLFSSHQEERSSIGQQSIVDSEPSRTVNPASLSPEMRPVVESNASSSDMTQHPAAMLCDLQCQSEEQRPWASSTSTISQILATILFINFTSTLLSPLSQIANSLRTGSSLSPTNSILTSILWLVTTTASLSNSTSMNSSTTTNTTSPRPKFSLRIRLLNRLLASSPLLARPLMDATMAAMRLQSEQQLTRDCLIGAGSCDHRDVENSPSLEALMTLLWAIHVFEKKREYTPELDVAMDGRQAGELDRLFRPRDIGDQKEISYVSSGGGTLHQKSLEEWRPAFKHDHP
jgi:transcriptional activator HAC1